MNGYIRAQKPLFIHLLHPTLLLVSSRLKASMTLRSTTIAVLPWHVLRCKTRPRPKRQPAATTGLQQVTPTAELDFELIWPDSEDLFQTIMSSDAVNHWQVPLGTLPFPAENYAASNSSFGSPSSFDDRVPSIGIIPSGGNHQAVQNVSKMITSLVSMSITAEIVGLFTLSTVFQRDSCGRVHQHHVSLFG
jgi:hypothetical protein